MTTYKVTEAHSGTDTKEIQKAKRFFRRIKKENKAWEAVTDVIEIRFEDVNSCITAAFINEYGEEVCERCLIYSA